MKKGKRCLAGMLSFLMVFSSAVASPEMLVSQAAEATEESGGLIDPEAYYENDVVSDLEVEAVQEEQEEVDTETDETYMESEAGEADASIENSSAQDEGVENIVDAETVGEESRQAEDVDNFSDESVKDITRDGYTVVCTVSDSGGIAKVAFPTWTESNGQDDLIWHNGNLSGNTASFRVKRSDHKGEFGYYITHIYAYDNAGNATCADHIKFSQLRLYIPQKTRIVLSDTSLSMNVGEKKGCVVHYILLT